MITYHFKDSTYNAQFNLCFYSVDRFLMFVPVRLQLALSRISFWDFLSRSSRFGPAA